MVQPMFMKTYPSSGIVLILGAAVLWGTTGTAQSFAPLTLSSYWVGACRLLVSGVFFVLWLWLTNARSLSFTLIGTLPWRLVLLAAASMAIYNLAFFAGIRITGVATGTAIAIGSGPVWAGTLQIALTRQLPRARWWLAVSIAVSGLLTTTIGSGYSTNLRLDGVCLCLISGLAYAVYTLATKRLITTTSVSITTAVVFTTAAVFAVPVAYILVGQPELSTTDISVMLWLGIIATGVAYLLFSAGLQYVTSATGVALVLVEPIVAVFFAILIVGERPGIESLMGLSVVFIGLCLIVRSELRESSGS